MATPPRTRSREFALQGIYQHLVGKNASSDIDSHTRNLIGFHKADEAHYNTLLQGCIDQHGAFDALLEKHIDRPLQELAPVEHAVLWIGIYEFRHCPEIPLRVVLNECIELAKNFGGTDGHKYVNGVLHALSQELRPHEKMHSPNPAPSIDPIPAPIPASITSAA